VIKRYNIYKFRPLVVKIISLLLFSFITLQAYSQTSIYVLKAVYLEKFSRFVTWPEECLMDDPEKPFVISVIGKTPLYKNLEQIYSTKKINNKKVEIKKINNLFEIENSHILVIAESEKKNLQNILALTEKLPVLTISESPNFAKEGVLINFIEEKNKLKFEVNETAVIKSPIQMSFYLMNSAKIVKPVKDN
jgi:uncharacterized protein DUF4154